MNDVELRLVWLAAERIGYPFGTLVQMLLLTGQRRDEVSGMRRAEVRNDVWTIPAERTKSGVEHDVPLTDAAQRVLATVPHVVGTDLLFTTTGKTPVSGYSNAKERLDAQLLQIAGETRSEHATIEPWRLHDIRRTVASGMARLGVAVNVIEAILNHRSGQLSGVAAVYNRYSYAAEKRRALERWSNHIHSIVERF